MVDWGDGNMLNEVHCVKRRITKNSDCKNGETMVL